MFTKFKQAIETWLRSIVREEVAAEVARIDRDLNAERSAFVNIIAATVGDINAAVDRLSELSHIGEAQRLRDHIRDLEAKFTGVLGTLKALHPTLKV